MIISKQWKIEGNIPSLKNSKIKTKRGIFPSKTVTKFLQEQGIKSYSSARKEVIGYKTRPNKFVAALNDFPKQHEYPIKLGFYFIRRTKADFDFNNATQILLDLLTAHNFIEDDCCRFILPYPILNEEGHCYHVDKENPGCIIQILK